MKINHLDKQFQMKLLRAIKEFDLIKPKDKILIGLSGGKDSAFLTYALSVIQKYCGLGFEIEAVTVDLGFSDKLNTNEIAKFCDELSVKFNLVKTHIADIIKLNGEKNPCAKCAYFRRAAINDFAVKNGFNKIALAHHQDDASETLIMNILYSGKIATFMPDTYLTRSNLHVIRPMIYLSEKEVIRGIKQIGYSAVKNPCIYTCNTARYKVKELIKNLNMENRAVKTNIASVLRMKENMELWPELKRKG